MYLGVFHKVAQFPIQTTMHESVAAIQTVGDCADGVIHNIKDHALRFLSLIKTIAQIAGNRTDSW